MSDTIVSIGGDDTGLDRAIRAARSKLTRFGSDVRTQATAFTKYAAVAATAMAGVSAAVYKTRSTAIDHLAKTSDALGIATEKLQALNHVAELNGVSAEQMAKGLQRMERGLGEAARKGGTTADALSDVGVNLSSIINLTPDQQIQKLAGAIANVENQSLKASIASDLFGRDGVRMLKVLTQLQKEGVEPTAKELEALGITLSRIDAARVEAANDAFFKGQQVVEGFTNHMTTKFAPVIEMASNKFTQAAKDAGGMGNLATKAFNKIITAAGFVLDAMEGVKRAFQAAADVGIMWFSKMSATIIQKWEGLLKLLDLNPFVNLEADIERANQLWRQNEAVAAEAWQNIKDNLEKPLPSAALKKFVEEAEQAANKAAAAVVGSAGGSGESETEGDSGFESRLARIKNQYKTEEALYLEHLQIQKDLEQAWREGKLVSDDEYYTLQTKAYKDHLEQIKKLNQDSEEQKNKITLQGTANTLNALARGFSQAGALTDASNRKSFERQKRFSLGAAMLALPSAVVQTFNNNGGWPMGLIPAGLMLGEGLKRIQDIKSTQYGGGGGSSRSVGASSGGGGGQSSQAQTPTAPGGTLTVQGISAGSFFDGEQVRGLYERLSEHQQNGGTVLFA